MSQVNRTIAITGASGFIGKRLVTELVHAGGYEIRVFSRDKERDLREERFGKGVEIFEGDLSDPVSLKGFFLPGCTVINLVYLWNAGEAMNLACTHNLLEACKDAKVARVLNCSTAAVAGRAPNDLIDEKNQSFPISEYGITKLKIERNIIAATRDNFDTVILRPTSVFGVDGEPLKKLAFDISEGNRWKNYLKSCLFGERRMNLVPVANVVAAIIFLIQRNENLAGGIFIVSNDDEPKNNFGDVENFLMNALDVPEYLLPRLPIPLGILQLLLTVLGRNNVNPRCNFDPSKLRNLGFNSPVSLSEGLTEYADWYKASCLEVKHVKAS